MAATLAQLERIAAAHSEMIASLYRQQVMEGRMTAEEYDQALSRAIPDQLRGHPLLRPIVHLADLAPRA